MSQSKHATPALYRATETCFWLLLLSSQLPAAAARWLLGQLLRLTVPFRVVVDDLFRWRGRS